MFLNDVEAKLGSSFRVSETLGSAHVTKQQLLLPQRFQAQVKTDSGVDKVGIKGINKKGQRRSSWNVERCSIAYTPGSVLMKKHSTF
jgi:hypothetical protein